jgi:hypothetical protein
MYAVPIYRKGWATIARSISLPDATAAARRATHRPGVLPAQPATGTR